MYPSRVRLRVVLLPVLEHSNSPDRLRLAQLPVPAQEGAVVEAEQRAPAKDCRAASAAWAAGSALQWAVRGVALREAVRLAGGRKLLTTFTEAAQAEVQVWAAAQPRPRREAQALAAAQHREREAPQVKAQRRLERPAWPAQPQPEARARPSKARARRIRNNHIQESIPKKTN